MTIRENSKRITTFYVSETRYLWYSFWNSSMLLSAYLFTYLRTHNDVSPLHTFLHTLPDVSNYTRFCACFQTFLIVHVIAHASRLFYLYTLLRICPHVLNCTHYCLPDVFNCTRHCARFKTVLIVLVIADAPHVLNALVIAHASRRF